MNVSVNIRGSSNIPSRSTNIFRKNFDCFCLIKAWRDGKPASTRQVNLGVLLLTSSSRRTAVMYIPSTGAKDTSIQLSHPYSMALEKAASNTFRLTKKGASWLRERKMLRQFKCFYFSATCAFKDAVADPFLVTMTPKYT